MMTSRAVRTSTSRPHTIFFTLPRKLAIASLNSERSAMPWKFLVVAIAAALQCTSVARAQQRLDVLLYTGLEEQVRKEVKEVLAAFRQAAAREKVDGDAASMKKAIAGLKSMFYNKAYIHASCQAFAIESSGQDSERAKSTAAECVAKRMAPMAKFTDLVEFGKELSQRNLECEMRSRLSEVETSFPPYPFLSDEDGG